MAVDAGSNLEGIDGPLPGCRERHGIKAGLPVDARPAAIRRSQSDFSHSVQMRPMIFSAVEAYSCRTTPFLSAALIYKWFNAASTWVVATGLACPHQSLPSNV